MPRKAKEKEELSNIEKKESNIKKTTTTKKSTTSKKATTTTKSTAKETTIKKTSTKKTTSSSTKKDTTTKKTTTTSKKTTAKTATVKKTSAKKKNEVKLIPTEYYDLPQKYNKTVVKILAQTPKRLFIYWEISDADINKYKKQYGENFFETTRPVLIIHNNTLNYNFEVEINDFANSWYLNINDSKSTYTIELGRRPIENNNNIKSNYIHITSSNQLESPNDRILFNTNENMIYFRNIKTGQVIKKSMTNLYFMQNIGKIYNVYDLYKELYKNEENLDSLSNPSS